MNFLEEKIMADGVVKAGDILKVDNFLLTLAQKIFTFLTT